MHPLLFEIGSFPVHTYGFLIAIGFLVGLYTIRRLAIRGGLNVEQTLNLTFWSLFIGFVGARLLFVITLLDSFLQHPASALKFWEGGLVFFGGPLAAMPFVIWYTRRYKLPIWRTLDVLAPAVAIGHSIGRLGCLMAGCCHGKPTNHLWGIRFYSDLVDRSLHGVPIHPTQLYESISLLLLFFGLIWRFRRKSFDGQIALVYFMSYSVIRSIIEIFRGDAIRGFVIDGVLSTSQSISILVFIVSAVAYMARRRTSKMKKS
jgi:phosphatidylglycerol:prolipoprotein diacylglycerol transferase